MIQVDNYTVSEIWKPIAGWEGLYEISNLGRVKTVARKTSAGNRGVPETIRKPNIMKGYHCIALQHDGKVKVYRIHRLVIEAFGYPQPTDEHQVNHIDGNKANNCIWNLEWVTPKENTDHAFETGLRKRTPTQETRDKMREALYRRYENPMERKKTSEDSKKMWQTRKESGWKSWKTWR